jgi:hypothetical protein
MPTGGAFLPAGYQKSDDPLFPWLCPVRSCRKKLQSLAGLGKHFCVGEIAIHAMSCSCCTGTNTELLQNSHRATRFNDNLDGTLTDLGTYGDFPPGHGKSSGGFAKPCLVASRGSMSLAESPMVEPSLHYRAEQAGLKPTIPQRGGPHRRSVADHQPVLGHSDSADTDDKSIPHAARSITKPHRPPSETDAGRRFTMANPDRPYDMWPGKPGALCVLPWFCLR